MFVLQLCATKISLTCRSLGDHHKGNVYIVPTAFSFWILPGPIFGNLPNLTSAFITEITSMHTFTSSTITVESKCQYIHPVKKCVGKKSCKYWELSGLKERGMRNNSCSQPEFQSVGYCDSWSCCSFAAPTGSEPLGTKEKLPNPVTRFPRLKKVTFLGTQAASCISPPSALGWVGCFLSVLSQGDANPWKKYFILKWGSFPSCSKCTLFTATSLLHLPCPCVTVQLILCLPVKCSWLLVLLRWIAQLMQTGCVFILCCATATATRVIKEWKCGS